MIVLVSSTLKCVWLKCFILLYSYSRMDPWKFSKKFEFWHLFSLDIKEGKTSLDKIVEDYEEEREMLHERIGVIQKEDGILPTRVNKNLKKRSV